MIEYKTASSSEELHQILALQKANLPNLLSSEEKDTEGFLTVVHDFKLLNRMNDACPHIIAKDGDKLVGYTLCMHPKFGEEIEVLKSMFEEINRFYNGSKFIVMGQVCVDKDYRKQGVFRKLYETMIEKVLPEFTAIITEVDAKNIRSVSAHYAVGFSLLSRYHFGGRDWELIIIS